MKILITVILIAIASISANDYSHNLIPPGKYNLVVDDKFKDQEIGSKITLEYDRFVILFPDKIENLEVEWIDEDSFVVKNYTESANPKAFEMEQLKNYRASFNIVKAVKDEFYFVLGCQVKRDTLLFGKFVKIRQ